MNSRGIFESHFQLLFGMQIHLQDTETRQNNGHKF
jgi:hypothetical protein